jgi:hypothetical protein
MNYIKIEIKDSLPYVSMEYDSLESFRDLIFTMLSPKGEELFLTTIEKDLIEKNKSDELEIMKLIQGIIKESLFKPENNYIIDPSSFK